MIRRWKCQQHGARFFSSPMVPPPGGSFSPFSRTLSTTTSTSSSRRSDYPLLISKPASSGPGNMVHRFSSSVYLPQASSWVCQARWCSTASVAAKEGSSATNETEEFGGEQGEEKMEADEVAGEEREEEQPDKKERQQGSGGATKGGSRKIQPQQSVQKPSDLNEDWTKQLIVKTLLQKLVPRNSQETKKVSLLLQELSQRWKIDTKPLSPTANELLLRYLGQYALGEKRLEVEVFGLLNYVFGKRLQRFNNLEDTHQMRALLEWVEYVKPNDNLFRIVSRHKILLPPQAFSYADEFGDFIESDPYDSVRENTKHNVYAIDSATTSEVDDAIGLHVDEKTGEEWITVFVSDATVYCPFDSELEKASARTLTTTTYLPEGVWFMLPERTIKAATLREDRPCRTFEARFRLDAETGAVLDYYVTVGWCHNLRRITYDEAQALYDAKKEAETKGQTYDDKLLSSSPKWMSPNDVATLHRIHDYARKRLETRVKHQGGANANLPQPLVKVSGVNVVTLEDQILCTIDARVAVAEMMIAANEVCSKVAQEIEQPIPFRGSRPLSPSHEATVEYVNPPGLVALRREGEDVADNGLAAAIYKDIESLKGVTRAGYSHEPLYHNGLATSNYCHSTSPLRRYADMLVHHQLKTAIGRQHDIRSQEFIPNFEMAELCRTCSDIGNSNRVMQMKSMRFWVLRYLRDNVLLPYLTGGRAVVGSLRGSARSKMDVREVMDRYGVVRNSGDFLLQCLVGQSSELSTAYIRPMCPPTAMKVLGIGEEKGGSTRPRFASEVYISELQLTHTILHSNIAATEIGASLQCRIRCLDPMADVLDLEVVSVEATKADSMLGNKLTVALGAD